MRRKLEFAERISARLVGGLTVVASSALAWGAFAAPPAVAAGSLVSEGFPPSTESIELVGQERFRGFEIEFFRNREYTCGISGYQTFLVASPANIGENVRRPLYVRLHGGGTGAWSSDGTYHPAWFYPQWLDEEPFEQLRAVLFGEGLAAQARSSGADFRFLVPSMCDHDLYSGVGARDWLNPNGLDENRRIRSTDGLLGTEAALDFTRSEFATSATIAHGTSAGSVGAFSLAYAAERLGNPLSGIVMDSGVADERMRTVAQVADWRCVSWLDDFDYDQLGARIGPLLQAENLPKMVVARGELDTPIMLVWNPGDPTFCGSVPIRHIDPGFGLHTSGGTDFVTEPLSEAIGQRNPGGHSVNYRLCVTFRFRNRGPTPPCNRHSPTVMPYWEATPPGDTLNGGRDYNRYIMNWIEGRLRTAG